MTYNHYSDYTKNSYWGQPQYGAGVAGQAPVYGAQPYTGAQPYAGSQPYAGAQPPYVTPPAQAGAVYPGTTPPGPQIPGMLPLEQSYIENILRLNKGKLVTVHAIFDAVNGNGTTRDFKGIIEAAGRDHLILSDPQTGMRYLIPMVYFGFATFEEELDYDYPYGAAAPGIPTYTPR